MKKSVTFLAMFLSLSLVANTQGVSNLFGLVGGNVQPNQSSNGFLFSTNNTGTNFQLQYDFPVTTFGANPQNLEMIPFNGKLYGTTALGGANNYGTIFEYDPTNNNYVKKFDFGANLNITGGSPKGSLLLYNNKFYGLAADFGAAGGGVIFEWDPVSNIFLKRYDFVGAGGTKPQNSLRLLNGKMYGTTLVGGASNLGTVFEWDPATNAYRNLLDLNGGGASGNGSNFVNNVTVYNNKLYATTLQGGPNNNGTLLVIDPALPIGSNTTIIKVFDAASGGNPGNNEMIVHNNMLYGCLGGGGVNGQGVLFSLNPATNTYTKLFDFSFTASGGNPAGKLVPNGSVFLGLCNVGGVNSTGTIFEWDPANPTTVVRKFSFLTNNYDNPINPGSTLALFNSKFYAVTTSASFVNQGALFEYDYATNTVTKKKSFNAAENGRIPFGKPVLLNGKIYGTCHQGPQEIFGTVYGCLWEFDPSTALYSRKFLFDFPGNAANGRAPVSSPIAYNNKLYGTTNNGGNVDRGVLYSFDPATNAYARYSLRDINGDFPIGEPTIYNDKLYGMTNSNGAGNNGIVYSFDPATNTLSKLFDVQTAGSNTPSGGFVVYNNKLYGATSTGGTNNIGGIIMFDPITNTATTVAPFVNSLGSNIANKPTLYNNKLYMTALSGGLNGRGAIMQFDPATNILTNVYNFSTVPGGVGFDPKGELTVVGNKLFCITQEGNAIVKVVQFDPATNTATATATYNTTNLNVPVTRNGLTVVPAFIANGISNSCQTFPTVVINGANNNQWVPILNTTGDVVAEIKANGNNLGNVNASMYINNTTVREDFQKRLYLDRNITISTQNPVSNGSVSLRLYIKSAEFLALKNTFNSLGQPSGVNDISNLAIFKNNDSCTASLVRTATQQPTTFETYEYGYVLSCDVSSFSTFFFAKNSFAVLPVTLVSFNAIKQKDHVKLNWQTQNEVNITNYEIERSNDGIGFNKITDLIVSSTSVTNNYSVIDDKPLLGNNYYRIKMIEKDGGFSYSNIINVKFNGTVTVSIQPNPSSNFVTVKGLSGFQQLQVIDFTGRVLLQKNIQNDLEELNINNLAKGVYVLKILNGNEHVSLKLIKD